MLVQQQQELASVLVCNGIQLVLHVQLTGRTRVVFTAALPAQLQLLHSLRLMPLA